MHKVEKKAAAVLENVKRKNVAGSGKGKGKDKGDGTLGEMDALTEAFLKPQIFREAFAVELPTIVDLAHRRQHAERAGGSTLLCFSGCWLRVWGCSWARPISFRPISFPPISFPLIPSDPI